MPPRVKQGAGIAAALAVAVPFVAAWEGTRTDPYRDIVGVMTVCTGQTHVPMHHYTRAQCETMLRDRLGKDADTVVARNPDLLLHPYALAAATSLEYNIGAGAYDRSSVARRFDARDYRGACDAMLRYSYAGGRFVPGLRRRREAERRLCLTETAQ